VSDDRDTLNTIITTALAAAGVDPTTVDRAGLMDDITQQWRLVPKDGEPDLNITITDTEWHHVATGITVRFQPG
jgi:hypothetical protein